MFRRDVIRLCLHKKRRTALINAGSYPIRKILPHACICPAGRDCTFGGIGKAKAASEGTTFYLVVGRWWFLGNQKRGGTALDEPWSNRLKSFFRASPTPAFNRLSYVRLDSRTTALQKIRRFNRALWAKKNLLVKKSLRCTPLSKTASQCGCSRFYAPNGFLKVTVGNVFLWGRSPYFWKQAVFGFC